MHTLSIIHYKGDYSVVCGDVRGLVNSVKHSLGSTLSLSNIIASTIYHTIGHSDFIMACCCGYIFL